MHHRLRGMDAPARAPTKAKSRESAYSQALNQTKIDRQRSRSRESREGRQSMVYGGWSLDVEGGIGTMMNPLMYKKCV